MEYSVAEAVARFAALAGVRYAYGVNGGAVAPFVAAVDKVGLELVHTRHESGAAFMATESFFADGAPGLMFATTGPGLTNAITGLAAAAWDGARVIAVVGGTRQAHRGRDAFQETGPASTRALTLLGPRVHTAFLATPADARRELERLRDDQGSAIGSVTVLVLPDDTARQSIAPPHPTEALPPQAPAIAAPTTDARSTTDPAMDPLDTTEPATNAQGTTDPATADPATADTVATSPTYSIPTTTSSPLARGFDSMFGPPRPPGAMHPPAPSAATSALGTPEWIGNAAERVAGQRFALWLGFGARGVPNLQELAERSGCVVMASPRAKGIFPEHHPQYLGVTGLGGHEHVPQALAEYGPEYVVVLGTGLSEFTSNYNPDYVPGGRLIHVDVDPTVFARAYPQVSTLGVQADARVFVEALTSRLEATTSARATQPSFTAAPSRPAPVRAGSEDVNPTPHLHPARVMDAVQRVVVERSDAIVLTEAGNAFAWGSRALAFSTPGRYRTSTRFGAMGHASAGVVGAALATGRKAVAILGDGALLMTNEINTAVAHRVPAVWLVLNDGQYGMVHHGMRAIGLSPQGTSIPRVDFVAFARSQGADGVAAASYSELCAALETAMQAPQPFVVDVRVDPSIPPPFGTRNERLRA